jgi:hypothetical protein
VTEYVTLPEALTSALILPSGETSVQVFAAAPAANGRIQASNRVLKKRLKVLFMVCGFIYVLLADVKIIISDKNA